MDIAAHPVDSIVVAVAGMTGWSSGRDDRQVAVNLHAVFRTGATEPVSALPVLRKWKLALPKAADGQAGLECPLCLLCVLIVRMRAVKFLPVIVIVPSLPTTLLPTILLTKTHQM